MLIKAFTDPLKFLESGGYLWTVCFHRDLDRKCSDHDTPDDAGAYNTGWRWVSNNLGHSSAEVRLLSHKRPDVTQRGPMGYQCSRKFNSVSRMPSYIQHLTSCQQHRVVRQLSPHGRCIRSTGSAVSADPHDERTATATFYDGRDHPTT